MREMGLWVEGGKSETTEGNIVRVTCGEKKAKLFGETVIRQGSHENIVKMSMLNSCSRLLFSVERGCS